MTPKIKSGQLVTVTPVDPREIRIKDVVLCHVGHTEYLHRVIAIKGGKHALKKRFLIGNNHGKINGWTNSDHVYGKLVDVQ